MMISPLDILSIESWILLATLVVLARYYVHRRWQYLKKLGISHDQPSILKMGNLTDAFGKGAFEYDNKQKQKYGPVWGSYSALAPAINIHDPDMLRQIYIKEFRNFPTRQNGLTKIGGKELSNGLTAVEDEQWKRIRSTMTPTFSTSKLKQMAGIIEWCAENAVEALNRKLKNSGGTFNSKTIFSRLSLDIICSAAFSTNVKSQDDSVKEPEIAKQAKDLFAGTLSSPLIILCLLFPFVEKLIGKFNIALIGRGKSLQYFKDLSKAVISRRQENPHAQGRVDFMQLMLEAEIPDKALKKGLEKGMTRTEIIGNSMLMILAGYENTGNTMSFVAYNLAQHPEIQTEVQKEIDEMIKTHEKFSYESVNSLKLLDMCVNETLRLYNPILKNARICENEVTVNGLTIPKGVTVSIPTFGLSHDPEYWDEPNEFRPERMRDMSQIDPMVFQPFGAGPRNCIGMRFALMEIKMSLAKILHQFTIVPAEDTPKPPLKLKFSLGVRPEVDYDLRVVRRKKDE